MFERFSKGLLGLFGSGASAGKGGGKGAAKPANPRDQALAQIRQNQSKVMTPERAELIRNAMEVHRAKKAILADLDDEQKQKLVTMAMRAFLNEGREPPPGKTGAAKAGGKAGAEAGGKTAAPAKRR